MWSCVLFSLILWQTGSSITINDCPNNLEHDEHLAVFEDKCYYFYLNIQRQFHDAQEVCRQNGGNLASVKTSMVNKFMWSRIKNGHNFYGKVWIGLSDQDVEGKYEWRDGSRMDYNNFESGAGPNEGFFDISHNYQDCVAMKSFDGKWTDLRCKDSFLTSGYREPFVCEYSQKPYAGPQVTKDDCHTTMPRDEHLKVLDNSCYYFYQNSKLDFPTAQTTCQYHGGNLVSIKSQRVQDFIWKTLRYTYEFEHETWIGLRDDKDDGVFVWRDGSVAEYENFARRTESYYHRDCVSISSNSGHWFDRDCKDRLFSDHHKYFICEFHATPKTTTTTTTPTTSTSTLRPTTTMSTTTTHTPTTTTTTTTNPPTTTTSATTNPPTTTTNPPTTTASTSTTTTHIPTTTTNPPTTSTSTSTTTTHIPTTTTKTPTTTKKTPTTTTQAPTTFTTKTQSTSTKIQTTTTNAPTTISSSHPPTITTSTSTTSVPTTPPTTTTTTTTTTTSVPTTPPTTTTITPTPTSTTGNPSAQSTTLTTMTTQPPLPETTTKPTTTSTPGTTFPKETTTVAATCPPIVCDLDCGMSGFDTNPDDGCMVCKCQEE